MEPFMEEENTKCFIVDLYRVDATTFIRYEYIYFHYKEVGARNWSSKSLKQESMRLYKPSR